MCNKTTCKSGWARRTRADTHNISSSTSQSLNTVSASALGLRKEGLKAQHTWWGDWEHVVVEQHPPSGGSASFYKAIFLWNKCLSRWTPRGPDMIGSLATFTVYAAMETQATWHQWCTEHLAHACPVLLHLNQRCGWIAAVPPSSLIIENLSDHSNACLKDEPCLQRSLKRENVCKLSLRLILHVLSPWPKNKTLASVYQSLPAAA